MIQKSNYICGCGNLLYKDVKNKKEYCLNKECKNHGDIKNIKRDYNKAEEEFKKIESKIKFSSFKFGNKFKKFLFEEQNRLISNIFLEGKLNIDSFLYISYLIHITKNISFEGRNQNPKNFQIFLDENYKAFTNYLFFQEIKEENYVLVDTYEKKGEPLILKYIEAIREQQKEYGLVKDGDVKDSFTYEKIGVTDIERIPFKLGMDFGEYFRNFFTLMIQLELITKTNLLFANIFDRDFSRYSIAGLIFLSHSARTINNLNVISKKEIKNTLEKMEFQEEEIKKFIDFILGIEDKIPFVLVEKENILYSKGLLFMMALKFMGHLKEKPIVQELKRDIGFVFEEKVREILRDKGYVIPFNKGFKLFKKSFEYDIIALDTSKKKIVLIESKFHDLPASALSGKNILNIKLNNKESGEISICERQIKRRDELSKNLLRFQEKCKEKGLDIELKNFEVEAIAILKFTPLLTKYNNIELMSFKKMINRL